MRQVVVIETAEELIEAFNPARSANDPDPVPFVGSDGFLIINANGSLEIGGTTAKRYKIEGVGRGMLVDALLVRHGITTENRK